MSEEVVEVPGRSTAGPSLDPLVQEVKTEIDTSSITAKYSIRFIEIIPFLITQNNSELEFLLLF